MLRHRIRATPAASRCCRQRMMLELLRLPWMLLVNPFYSIVPDPWFAWRAERTRAKLGRRCAAQREKGFRFQVACESHSVAARQISGGRGIPRGVLHKVANTRLIPARAGTMAYYHVPGLSLPVFTMAPSSGLRLSALPGSAVSRQRPRPCFRLVPSACR